jgi:hypothetical protein
MAASHESSSAPRTLVRLLAKDLELRRLACTIRVLQELFPPSAKQEAAVEHLSRDARMLARRPARAPDDLLGIEGLSAALYFNAGTTYRSRGWDCIDSLSPPRGIGLGLGAHADLERDVPVASSADATDR